MRHPDLGLGILASFLASAFVGFVGLPIWWFFVYAFSDTVTAQMHLVFLVGVGVLALVSGAVSIAFSLGLAAPERRRAALAVACATTAVMFLGALGVGTVVSMVYEDQGSITADQPDLPFVALVVVCVLGSAAAIGWASRSIRRAP